MLRKCTLSENPGSQLNLSFTGRIGDGGSTRSSKCVVCTSHLVFLSMPVVNLLWLNLL